MSIFARPRLAERCSRFTSDLVGTALFQSEDRHRDDEVSVFHPPLIMMDARSVVRLRGRDRRGEWNLDLKLMTACVSASVMMMSETCEVSVHGEEWFMCELSS